MKLAIEISWGTMVYTGIDVVLKYTETNVNSKLVLWFKSYLLNGLAARKRDGAKSKKEKEENSVVKRHTRK